MFTQHTARSSILAVSIAMSLNLLSASASADHAWANYHWARSSNPKVLALGDNVSTRWDSALRVASSDWSVSNVLNTSVVAGRTTPAACRSVAGRVEVCNSTYGSTGWLGVASISVNGNHITAATVRVNDTYFNTATYNTAAWRALVMCQEVGHAFGLDHQDENFNNANLGTCMDYTNSPGSNQHPNGHDYDQLSSIYAHLDAGAASGGSAASAAPPAMSALVLAGPGQWGHVTSRYPSGKPMTYELDFGRGFKIVTHVFWTLEAVQDVAEERDAPANR